jgi:hypothetical protein
VVTSSILILLGGSVMQIAWVLHGIGRRLTKLEHKRNELIRDAHARVGEPGAAPDRWDTQALRGS